MGIQGNPAPASDRQCKYLNYLRDKAGRIQAAAEARGVTVYREPLANVDYFAQRDLGLTSGEASALIGSWRNMVLFGNMTLSLLGLPQIQ